MPPKTRLAIVSSYLSGDVGSLSEGPAVGEKAPVFSALAVGGKDRITFPNRESRRPVVLIFGSFT